MLTLAYYIYLLIHYTKGTIKHLFYLSYCIKIQILFKLNVMFFLFSQFFFYKTQVHKQFYYIKLNLKGLLISENYKTITFFGIFFQIFNVRRGC